MGIPWRGISDNLYSGFAGFSLAMPVTRILNLGHQLRFWDSLRRHAIDGDLVLACPHLRGVRLINGTPGGSVSAQAAEGVLGLHVWQGVSADAKGRGLARAGAAVAGRALFLPFARATVGSAAGGHWGSLGVAGRKNRS